VFKDTTAKDVAASLKGKKVVAVKRWGKYFWCNSLFYNINIRIEMESPPHPVLHFGKENPRHDSQIGMTGWIRVRGAKTHYSSPKDEDVWPPRFVKFILKIAKPKTRPSLDRSLIPEIWGTEVAFVDARRLGRIRLIDAEDPFTESYTDIEICITVDR
jgi:formamidopyrimidine-DNA glycosylase